MLCTFLYLLWVNFTPSIILQIKSIYLISKFVIAKSPVNYHLLAYNHSLMRINRTWSLLNMVCCWLLCQIVCFVMLFTLFLYILCVLLMFLNYSPLVLSYIIRVYWVSAFESIYFTTEYIDVTFVMHRSMTMPRSRRSININLSPPTTFTLTISITLNWIQYMKIG